VLNATSGIFPGIFLLFCMAVCGYASLITGSCGASNFNPADSECVLLNDCDKEIKIHLRSEDVRHSSLRTESRLLLARAGWFIIFYLTYTFGTISITFIQPFLDVTSTTQAVFRPKKSQESGPNFPRGGPGMLELRNVF
jgi:hypothetical protein